MCTECRLGASSRIAAPLRGLPNSSLTRSRAVTSQTSTRLPRRAAASASAALRVLLPVPPLPVSTSRRRDKRRGSCRAVWAGASTRRGHIADGGSRRRAIEQACLTRPDAPLESPPRAAPRAGEAPHASGPSVVQEDDYGTAGDRLVGHRTTQCPVPNDDVGC